MAGPARIAALLNWYETASDTLGLRSPQNAQHEGIQALLARLQRSLGSELDPFSSWIRTGRIGLVSGPPTTQSWWLDKTYSVAHARILDSYRGREKVRFSQLASAISTGWMAARPSQSMGTRIDGPSYRTLLRWFMGTPLIPPSASGRACPLECGSPVDSLGDHAVCCGKNRAWERHLGVQQFLSRCLSACGVPHITERQVGEGSVPELRTDISILNWENGVDLDIGVAVCHPVPLSLDPVDLDSGSQVLAARAAVKVRKYQEACRKKDRTFAPFVVSTWGRLETAAAITWKEMVRKGAARLGGRARARKISEFHQGLSLAWARGVARQLQTTTLAMEGLPLSSPS